jgi:hypothetical protein
LVNSIACCEGIGKSISSDDPHFSVVEEINDKVYGQRREFNSL